MVVVVVFNTSVVGVQLVVKKCTWARSPVSSFASAGALRSLPLFFRVVVVATFLRVLYIVVVVPSKGVCAFPSTQSIHTNTHEEQHTKKKNATTFRRLFLFLCCLREESSLRERVSLRVLNARVLYMYIYKNGVLLTYS